MWCFVEEGYVVLKYVRIPHTRAALNIAISYKDANESYHNRTNVCVFKVPP